MNQSCQKVLRYLTGSENIDAVTIDELQKLVNENPYFPVAQFLLAQKLKKENTSHFLPQVQKTALYFFNPFWLHYQLINNPSVELSLNENEVQINSETSSDAIIQPDNESAVISEPKEEIAAITGIQNERTEPFLHEPDFSEKTFTTNYIQPAVPEAQPEEATEVLEEMAGVTPEIDNTTEVFLNEISVPETDKNQESTNPETTELDEHEQMFQNIKAMLDATSEEADADTKNTVVPIDPYYTIDYFASQGIKLELDQNPNDQLGKNLKKFTQWLKHMKKLGPEDASEAISRTETEADIQQIADRSNTAREVVTEAMALVLEKQGKKDKAIELYNKLSFLNRDKSAYFAGKIKNLKGY